MRKFDPWPVFFKREWNRNWPFLVGFAITGAIITKLSLGLTGKLSFQPDLFISNLPSKTLIFFSDPICFFFDSSRGRCQELSVRSEAQEVPFDFFILELNYSSYYSIAVKSFSGVHS